MEWRNREARGQGDGDQDMPVGKAGQSGCKGRTAQDSSDKGRTVGKRAGQGQDMGRTRAGHG